MSLLLYTAISLSPLLSLVTLLSLFLFLWVTETQTPLYPHRHDPTQKQIFKQIFSLLCTHRLSHQYDERDLGEISVVTFYFPLWSVTALPFEERREETEKEKRERRERFEAQEQFSQREEKREREREKRESK